MDIGAPLPTSVTVSAYCTAAFTDESGGHRFELDRTGERTPAPGTPTDLLTALVPKLMSASRTGKLHHSR